MALSGSDEGPLGFNDGYLSVVVRRSAYAANAEDRIRSASYQKRPFVTPRQQRPTDLIQPVGWSRPSFLEPGQQAALEFRRLLMDCRVSPHADGARRTTACRVLFRDSSRSQSREEPLAKLPVLVRDLAVRDSDRLLWVLGKQPLPDHSRLLHPAKLNQGHYESSQPR